MKATMMIGRLTIEVEGDGQKDLFQNIADIQEVFGQTHCGACGNDDVAFQVRTKDDYTFYEMACRNPKCRGRLSFGQNKKGGTLFPKRKTEDGQWLENGGWVVWKSNGQANGQSNGRPQQQRNRVSEPAGGPPEDSDIPF